MWEENWDVLALFQRYMTQWRASARGPIGLDFTVFHDALDRKGIKGDAFDEFVIKLRIIETQALHNIYKQT